jgi:Gly-Xaa carboxypeptidase
MNNYLRSDAYFHHSSDLLSSAIEYRTVTWDDMGPVGEDERWDTFPEFASWLERSFPSVNSTLQLDKVNIHSLVYTWEGSDLDLKPILLTAHQDVVPVNDDSLDQWEESPWSGDQDGHYIWGRGSVDTKDTLLGVMEAVEQLIDASFQPRRTVILAFGFDEEIKGPQGVAHIATFLKTSTARMALLSSLTREAPSLIFGVLISPSLLLPRRAALTLRLRSMFLVAIHLCLRSTRASGIMSQLITLIEDDIFSPKLDDENPFIDALRCGAAHGPRFPSDWAHHLLEDELGLLVEDVSHHPLFSFLCKTTVAVDVIHGGIKINALPETTTVSINHRVNIGDSIDGIKKKYTELAASVAETHNLLP